MHIRHYKYSKINYELWDKTISQSSSNLIYGFSWYLDVVSPGWEALISENYEFVMPLPVKRRLGFTYLVQPWYVQQLGIFSAHEIEPSTTEAFIRKIPYLSYQLLLNEQNSLTGKTREFPNLVLNLSENYETLRSGFAKNTLRNIQKAQSAELALKFNLGIGGFIEFYRKINPLPAHQLALLEKLLCELVSHNALNIQACTDKKGNILAAFCLVRSRNRLFYLFPASSTEGKKISAMFMVIDNVIRQYSKQPYLLDFEGSRQEGIARFFKGFGAINRPYYMIKQCRPQFLTGIF